MPLFDPDALQRWSGGQWTRIPDTPVHGFSIDSRKIEAGACFVALKTESRDGHDFLEAAAQKGASFALTERVVSESSLPQLVVDSTLASLQAIARNWRMQFSGKVVGVTGSCGKTSTKEMITTVLGAETLSTSGNLNNFLGVPLTLLRIDPQRHRFAVIEAGISEPGEMQVLADMIRPDVGVVTMVGAAHLEALESEEIVAREKSILLRQVQQGGHLVFPESCRRFSAFEEFDAEVHSISLNESRPDSVYFSYNYKLNQVAHSCRSTSETATRGSSGEVVDCRLGFPGGPQIDFQLNPMSVGMLSNAAVALTVGHCLGRAPEILVNALRDWKPASRRGEVHSIGDQAYYVDCYNANPDSMRDALDGFCRQFEGYRRLFVIGGMKELGSVSEVAHAAVGEAIELGAEDVCIFIGEECEVSRQRMLDRGYPTGRVMWFARAEEARDVVDDFRGAIFVKGSRAYALEQLVPVRDGRRAVSC